MALTATLLRQCCSRWVRWCLTIPAPAMVKPVNTPMAYIGMRAATLARVARRRAMDATGQHEDAVGEHQPVASHGQLARQERVLGHEAHQEREPGEAGVGGQDQDERGRRLQRVEEDVPERCSTVDELADLGDDRRRAGDEGHGVGERGQHRHPQEHRPRGCVLMSTRVVRALLACGSRKMLTPLEMRLGAGHGRAPVGEGPERDRRPRRRGSSPRSRAQGRDVPCGRCTCPRSPIAASDQARSRSAPPCWR